MAATLTKAADGVYVGPLFPRNIFNTVVLEGPEGDVVVDAGPPWSGRALARFLHGRDVVEHVVTHAHRDHVGSSAWLCAHTGAPLAVSAREADDFESGSIAYHAGAGGKFLIAPLGHKRRHVDRRLQEGDKVADFRLPYTHTPPAVSGPYAVVVQKWQLPVVVDGRPGVISGSTAWQPSANNAIGPASPRTRPLHYAIAGGLTVVLIGAVLLARRRARPQDPMRAFS